jgi:hypothetical protein
MKIKIADIPEWRGKIIIEQQGKCWICEIDLTDAVACLDHDHETGKIRGVLCNNCNGIEGKITNLAKRGRRDKTKREFIEKILTYWGKTQKDLIHPLHKTKDEKRLLRNKRARLRKRKKQA